MAPDITQLVTEGLDGAAIVLGTDGAPTWASELATAGARLFRAGRSEPAVAALRTNDWPSIELILGAILARRPKSYRRPSRPDHRTSSSPAILQARASRGEVPHV